MRACVGKCNCEIKYKTSPGRHDASCASGAPLSSITAKYIDSFSHGGGAQAKPAGSRTCGVYGSSEPSDAGLQIEHLDQTGSCPWSLYQQSTATASRSAPALPAPACAVRTVSAPTPSIVGCTTHVRMRRYRNAASQRHRMHSSVSCAAATRRPLRPAAAHAACVGPTLSACVG